MKSFEWMVLNEIVSNNFLKYNSINGILRIKYFNWNPWYEIFKVKYYKLSLLF